MNLRKLFLILVFVFSFFNVYSTTISSCNTTINIPGEYNLTNDIGPFSSSACVIINSNNVNLNCLDNTIFGNSSMNYLIQINSVDNVNISNCKLNLGYFNNGIYLGGTVNNVHVDNILIDTNSTFTKGIILAFGISSDILISNVLINNSKDAIRLTSVLDVINLTFKNIKTLNTQTSSLDLFNIGIDDSTYTIFNNVSFDNKITLGAGQDIRNFTFIDSTLDLIEFFNSGTVSVIGNKFINSNIDSLFSGKVFSNNTIINNTINSLVLNDLLVEGNLMNDNLFINNTFTSLSLSSSLVQNNTFTDNIFTNVSKISISVLPNNFSRNTYYNVTGGASTVCFFGGLVCDNSATVLPFAVEVITSAAVSVTSLPSFGFWSVIISSLLIFGGLIF